MSGGRKGDGERLTDVKVIKNDLANAVNRHGRMVGIVVTYRGLKSRLRMKTMFWDQAVIPGMMVHFRPNNILPVMPFKSLIGTPSTDHLHQRNGRGV